MRSFAFIVSLLVAAVAHAGAPRGEAPARGVVALVVTNNHSVQLARPDLRYADDDGAKYYELFRMLAPEDQVALLTDFDSDTARLFPQLGAIARLPSRANVVSAADALARKVESLRKNNIQTDFYFIYAGHGDIDHGRGFVELSDAAVNADDLDAMVFQRVHATHTHIILDSCNSFFVLNPRKPGGRRFPTPEEAAQAMAARLPNVGVFLSTSAEAQVYEWSELQSGIFSHAVRSGILGAADADGDGRVSYTELAAFVNLASKDVRNPLYRPAVFARGPGGQNDAPLLDLTTTNTATLELPIGEEQRVTVRDADELPWIDLHAEAGSRVRLHLPERLRAQLTVESRALDASGRVLGRKEGVAALDHPTLLAELEARPERGRARGPSELFRALFSHPFGRQALAAYLFSTAASAPPPIGIAQEDISRMRLLLRHTADIDRSRRMTIAATGFGAGALAIGVGAWVWTANPKLLDSPSSYGASIGLFVGGGLDLLLSTVRVLRRSKGELIYADFESRLDNPRLDPLKVVADTEQQLFSLYREQRRDRKLSLIFGWILSGVGSVGFVTSVAIPQANPTTVSRVLPVAFALGTALGIQTGVEASFETPIERMVRLWSDDPGIQRIPRVGATALPGGGALSVSGYF